ncbi:MAG: hypothetical protein ABEJ94_07105 [Halorientalis sp.]
MNCQCERPNSRGTERERMDRKQIIAIIFVLLMIGSPVAYATVSFF